MCDNTFLLGMLVGILLANGMFAAGGLFERHVRKMNRRIKEVDHDL